MPNYKERIYPGVLLVSAPTAVYSSIGILLQEARIIKFQNTGTTGIFISWDLGVHDHDFIPAGAFALYDFSSNSVSNQKLVAANQTNFYGKTVSGTGAMYITYFFAE